MPIMSLAYRVWTFSKLPVFFDIHANIIKILPDFVLGILSPPGAQHHGVATLR